MHLVRPFWGLALLFSLSACADKNLSQAELLLENDNGEVGTLARYKGDNVSNVIRSLLSRESLLVTGSVYERIAYAAAATANKSSKTDLISAELRAEAKSKNWLPTIGPSLSLTDLSTLATGIMIDQIILDNGRKKAERDFAAADVEVAAVNLSIEVNSRVQKAIGLYITGLREDEKVNYLELAIRQLNEFHRVVAGRVNGGLNNSSDLRLLESKISSFQALTSTSRDAALNARTELWRYTGQHFRETPRKVDLGTPPPRITSLQELKVEAETARKIAELEVHKAGLLPQIAATVNTSNQGTVSALQFSPSSPLSFGTPDEFLAQKVVLEGARMAIGEAKEEARLAYSQLMQSLGTAIWQESESSAALIEIQEGFEFFESQYDAGHRSAMEAASLFEELVQRKLLSIDAKYEVVFIQLELLKRLGLLVNGSEI